MPTVVISKREGQYFLFIGKAGCVKIPPVHADHILKSYPDVMGDVSESGIITWTIP